MHSLGLGMGEKVVVEGLEIGQISKNFSPKFSKIPPRCDRGTACT